MQQGDFNTEKNTVKIQRAATYIPGEGIHVGMTKTDNSERTISLPPSVMKLQESYNAELKSLAIRKANLTLRPTYYGISTAPISCVMAWISQP